MIAGVVSYMVLSWGGGGFCGIGGRGVWSASRVFNYIFVVVFLTEFTTPIQTYCTICTGFLSFFVKWPDDGRYGRN